MPDPPSQPTPSQPAPSPPAPSQNVNVAPSNQHAVTAFSSDTALDATTALLRSDFAPMTDTTDHKAIWACVPADATLTSLEVWSYFHGHNSVVAAKVTNGQVTGYGPDWLHARSDQGPKFINFAANEAPANNPTITYDNNLGDATAKFAKMAMGAYYEFPLLSAAAAPGHVPVVLAPEVGIEDKGHDIRQTPQKDDRGATVIDTKTGRVQWGTVHGPWCTESAGTNMGAFDQCIDDCLKRLHALNKPRATAPYLPNALGVGDIKRFYLTGHSGGGVPLYAACQQYAQMAGLKALPTTMVSYDATYNDYQSQLVAFLQTVTIGLAASQSRVIIIYTPGGTTEKITQKSLIPKAIAKVFPGTAAGVPDPSKYAFVDYRGSSASGDPSWSSTPLAHKRVAIPELRSAPIVVIRTASVPHDSIPQHFTPLILAASP